MAGTFINVLVRGQHGLRNAIRTARLGITPEQFVGRNVKLALMSGGTFALLALMFLDKMRSREFLGQNVMIAIIVFMVLWFFTYNFLMHTVNVYIRRQQTLLNRDVLFLGRYLLIKLQSGVPFYQALIDASKGGFGTSSRYVGEIVHDIELGTSIEQALANAADLSPSNEFRQILWQINTALRSGVDVTSTLRSILQEISSDQLIEVERYGKKLSSLSLFYMLLAIILPSLGLTLFVSFSGFLGLEISSMHLAAVIFAMVVIQFMFLSLFKSVRPQINL
jgi:pilus assembly protein TadC